MTDKTITRTQQLLAAIPALADKLRPMLSTSSPNDSEGVRAAHSASRPPVDVAMLDLIHGRELDWWVMLAIDEMAEAGTEPQNPPSSRTPSISDNCTWLAANAAWITEHNPDTDDCDGFPAAIRSLHWAYRRAAGDMPGPRISCPECGNRAFIGENMWMTCSEVPDHARTVRSIENEWRYRPAESTAEILARFTISEDRLHQWRKRGKLTPARREGRKLYWWPWDVFCLLNPVVAEAIAARDNVKEPA